VGGTGALVENWPPPRRHWKVFDNESNASSTNIRAGVAFPGTSRPAPKNKGERGAVSQQAERTTPNDLLLAVALRCQGVFTAHGIFFAFVGGFAMQQMGMDRETHYVDFVYEGGYRRVREALNSDESSFQVPVAADGAFSMLLLCDG